MAPPTPVAHKFLRLRLADGSEYENGDMAFQVFPEGSLMRDKMTLNVAGKSWELPATSIAVVDIHHRPCKPSNISIEVKPKPEKGNPLAPYFKLRADTHGLAHFETFLIQTKRAQRRRFQSIPEILLYKQTAKFYNKWLRTVVVALMAIMRLMVFVSICYRTIRSVSVCEDSNGQDHREHLCRWIEYPSALAIGALSALWQLRFAVNPFLFYLVAAVMSVVSLPVAGPIAIAVGLTYVLNKYFAVLYSLFTAIDILFKTVSDVRYFLSLSSTTIYMVRATKALALRITGRKGAEKKKRQ